MKRSLQPIDFIWFFLLVSGTLVLLINGDADAAVKTSLDSCNTAVNLCINLIGTMTLWLGIMNIASESGLTGKISKLISPIMSRLFPDVPNSHPAMGAMAMSIAANMLGLGNAATPLGLKAMSQLDMLNKNKAAATDAMIMFICINTSSVTVIPSTVIALRSAAGSKAPASIVGPSLLSTVISTCFAVLLCLILRKRRKRKNYHV